MVSPELQTLLENMPPDGIEALEIIALRLSVVKNELYTGEISFSVNANQGSVGDIHVNRREVVRIGKKKRVVRSRGV